MQKSNMKEECLVTRRSEITSKEYKLVVATNTTSKIIWTFRYYSKKAFARNSIWLPVRTAMLIRRLSNLKLKTFTRSKRSRVSQILETLFARIHLTLQVPPKIAAGRMTVKVDLIQKKKCNLTSWQTTKADTKRNSMLWWLWNFKCWELGTESHKWGSPSRFSRVMFLSEQADQKPAIRREDRMVVIRVQENRRRCCRISEGPETRRIYPWFLKNNLVMLTLIAPNPAKTIKGCLISTRRIESPKRSISQGGCS